MIQENGTPIYSFFLQQRLVDREVLVSGFVAAIQAFAKETMLSPDGGDIQSMVLSNSLLTFRLLNIISSDCQPKAYYFVLLTDLDMKKQGVADLLLEYLCLNFLNYNFGRFRKHMREICPDLGNFKEFDDFIDLINKSKWKDIKKKMKPMPGSLVQGLLNEIRDYLPMDQIINLHPKIVPLGPSYVWLSDDLTEEEEQKLLLDIKERVSKLFGEVLYNSLLEEVKIRLDRLKID